MADREHVIVMAISYVNILLIVIFMQDVDMYCIIDSNSKSTIEINQKSHTPLVSIIYWIEAE